MNISEFERKKPRQTHAAIINVKEKYETLLKETVIMDEADAVRVEMSNAFLKDLRKIMDLFKAGL